VSRVTCHHGGDGDRRNKQKANNFNNPPSPIRKAGYLPAHDAPAYVHMVARRVMRYARSPSSNAGENISMRLNVNSEILLALCCIHWKLG